MYSRFQNDQLFPDEKLRRTISQWCREISARIQSKLLLFCSGLSSFRCVPKYSAARECPTLSFFPVSETLLSLPMPAFTIAPNILQVSKVYQRIVTQICSNNILGHPLLCILSIKPSDFQLFLHIRVHWGAFKTNIACAPSQTIKSERLGAGLHYIIVKTPQAIIMCSQGLDQPLQTECHAQHFLSVCHAIVVIMWVFYSSGAHCHFQGKSQLIKSAP